DAFLDELEEMLISTDIGVATTLSVIENVRRGVSRAEIRDLAALKAAIKKELLDILNHATAHGVADARSVDESIKPYVLMLDAVTGQNGLEQARQFMKTADVTGVVLTKLDGTAKGGIAVAIAKELKIPIRYVGIGEQVDDLMVFDAESYVNGLFN